MDLPLWDPSDDQGYLSSFKGNYYAGDVWQCGRYSGYGPGLSVADWSGCYTEDHLLCDLSFGYWRDMMEEDALNKKSCLQVLKILMEKADEEIVKLEEDIVMLQCQLAWDDKEWSKPCSAAFSEKIDHLDMLIQILKKEITEDVHYSGLQLEQPEKLAPRLHDVLKPLLENHFLVKKKQKESSIIQMPALPAVRLIEKESEASTSKDDKNIEEKDSTVMLKTSERKSQFMELEETKINHPHQKKDAIINKFNESVHKWATDKLSEKVVNKPNKLQGKRIQNSALVKSGRRSLVKSEPSNPMVKDSSASTSIKEANSRGREKRRNNDKEVISKAKVTRGGLEHKSKVTDSHLMSQETETQISETVKLDCMKQRTEASSKVRKARVYRHAINNNVSSTKPSVKMKRKLTKFPEITEALEPQETKMKYSPRSFYDRRKHARKPKMKLNHQIQVQRRHEIETLVINQAKSISSLQPDGQGPQKKWRAAPDIVQNAYLVENIDMGSSSKENLKGQQKYGLLEKISKNGKKETKQQSNGNDIDGASEVTVTSTSSRQKVRKLSSTSQTIRDKKGLRNLLTTLAKTEGGASNSTTEEATDEVEDMPQNSSLCIKDVERLTLNDLKIIAKNQKLRGYSKLRKEELQKLLGLEPLYLRQKV